MLLRSHILPCLAGDWLRDVAPQKAMKMEKRRRSFILIQDAWLLNAMGVFIRTARSMYFKGCPKYYVHKWHPPPPCVRCSTKVSQVELIFTAHTGYWLLTHHLTKICCIRFLTTFLGRDTLYRYNWVDWTQKAHSSGAKWHFVVNSDGIQLEWGLAELSETHECTLGSRRGSKYPDT